VVFVGFVSVPRVYDEFAQAEVFCGLSRSEALGNVFLEAQAAGCAVIGTRVGGIPEIIEDGHTGFLVPHSDPAAAAEVLQKLITDAELRQRLAEEGRQNAEQYDWLFLSEQYKLIYQS
jgi:glycosyltransferase involved in cell wall biosynthesis